MNKELNGYELSRSWFDFCFVNPELITPSHAAVFFFAIEHCNRLGWKTKFGFPTEIAKEAVGIKSYNTYMKVFNDLVGWGFFKIIQKSKNQFSANIIALSKYDEALDKALDKALIKQEGKQDESSLQSNDSIDKQYNNTTIKQGNKEQEGQSEKNKEVEDCLENCLVHFPEHLKPSDSQKQNWYDTIEKLNRMDKIPFEKIIEIVKKTREDQFWSKNFLSLTKLRKKNREGITYAVVFNENIKNNEQLNQTGSIYSDDYKQRVLSRVVTEKN